MTFQRLCLFAAALGLSLSANAAEAQFELTPPLTVTSHAFSLTGAQLQLQQNNGQAQVQVTEVPVTYLPTSPQHVNAPSRRYRLWSVLWGAGGVLILSGALVWFVEQFNGASDCFSGSCGPTYYGAGMMTVGGLMLVGGVIGHIIGGARYRRRVREQGVVYLEGTTLHW